jgi:hypothetical protein
MKKLYFIALLIAASFAAGAQICTNPTDTVYSLNSITGSGSGQIIGVNINNAGTTLIGSPAAGSENANGLGFSPVTGKYYFFNKCGNGTATATEFVSYLPLSGTKQVLTKPPLFPNDQKMRSGTVNKAGTAYYCIFPGATTAMGFPVTGPAFYYYNIGADTWTRITQVFKDKNGNTVANITSLNSGDMAFDGNNNLWMLCSNSTAYALYRIKAPLPTTAVAFITVDTIIAQTPTPSAAASATPTVSITGIAFNSAGKLYISSGSATGTANAFHNKLYMLATPASPLVTVGTLTNGFGDDLTSCTYPMAVLPVTWVDFNASLQNDVVKLGWKVNEENNIDGYDVQFSTDASQWKNIAHINRDNAFPGLKQYIYTHNGYNQGNNYYRIVETDLSGKQEVSAVRVVSNLDKHKIFLAPNPTRDNLFFYHKDNSFKLLAQVFDKNGSMVYSTVVAESQQYISVAHLPKGVYVLKLLSAESNKGDKGYQFVKL